VAPKPLPVAQPAEGEAAPSEGGDSAAES
jgi:hypothetical protein